MQITFNPETDIYEYRLYNLWAGLGLDIPYSNWLKLYGLTHIKCVYADGWYYMFRLNSTEDRLIFKLKHGI